MQRCETKFKHAPFSFYDFLSYLCPVAVVSLSFDIRVLLLRGTSDTHVVMDTKHIVLVMKSLAIGVPLSIQHQARSHILFMIS